MSGFVIFIGSIGIVIGAFDCFDIETKEDMKKLIMKIGTGVAVVLIGSTMKYFGL